MNKREVYFKFIFTDYDRLSRNVNDSMPTNDGIDQIGEVFSLCRACPERVITYDQLLLNSNELSPIYYSSWASRDAERLAIKSYIQQYMNLPKYFGLRNYWDRCPCQEGGMSLIVSSSPEVGNTLNGFYDHFKSTYDNKYVYCSLVVSSGDFFYGWNLPDEVLEKSGLRDKIVSSRFHRNWYFTISEKRDYLAAHIANVAVGQEKRVFSPHDFKDGFNYGHQNDILYFVNYYDDHNNVYQRYDSTLFCRDTNGSYEDSDGNLYIGSYKNFPPNDHVSYYFVRDANDEEIIVTQSKKYYSSEVSRIGSKYYIKDTNIEVSPVYTVEKYDELSEDIKKDFIDLEATRRILHYGDYDYSSTSVTIPSVISGSGKSTSLLYEPPQEYIERQPIQIPYNLLRYALNDRPPFTDCETVLVMWVADRDPSSVADNDVSGLHGLNWQQYAIPISIRCCLKDQSDDKYCHDRFLVSYPHGKTSVKDDEYRLHTRRSESYSSDIFKKALYLQDLIEYSQDYLISYQHRNHYNKCLDIQKYLFNKIPNKFEELYVRRAYSSLQRHQQFYYIKVDRNKYAYDVNSANSSICIVDGNNHSEVFSPKSNLLQSHFSSWDFSSDDWDIDNNWFIALFSIDSPFINEVSGQIELFDAFNLKTFLQENAQNGSSNYTWEDIYLSSLGISPSSQINTDSLYDGFTASYSDRCFPLGFLDNHITIDSISYGSTLYASDNKIIVGFKNVFDYKFEELHHFHYYSTGASSGEYRLVEANNSSLNYSAYVMDYSA